MRIRTWAARFLVLAYLLSFGVFWFEGVQAYLRFASGPERFLGFAYLPILLLPSIGSGTVDGIVVHSVVWWWLFALQMVLGAAAIFMYPNERPRWRIPDRPGRLAGGSAGIPRAPRIMT